MKKILLLIVFCVIHLSIKAQTSLDYTGYTLTFYDEFDYPDLSVSPCPTTTVGTNGGTTFLDNWHLPSLSSTGCETTDPSQVSIPSPGSFPSFIRLSENLNPDLGTSATYPYINGLIGLNNGVGYGIIQVRARYPSGDAPANPAFFFAVNTEIDFPDVSVYSDWLPFRLRDWTYPGRGAYGVSKVITSSELGPLGISDLTGWHTYSVLWTPSNASFYIDDQYLTNIPFSYVRIYQDIAGQPYLSLNAYKDPCPATTTPGQNLDIDWVKVYQLTCSVRALNTDDISPLFTVIPDEWIANTIISSFPTPIVTNTLNATIFEAQSTTISPNFLADEAVLNSGYYPMPPSTYFPSSSPPSSFGLVHLNGFFEINSLMPCEPTPCNIAPINGDNCINLDGTIALTDAMSGGVWSSSNPTDAIVNASTGVVTGHYPGIYTITYTNGGCSTTKTITIVGSCGGRLSQDTSGNSHILADSSISGNTHQDNSLNNLGQLQIFPNPTQDNITISYPCVTSGQLDISIKDVSGRKLYTESVNCDAGNNAQQVVDMSLFAAGVYFVSLTLNDQHVVKKVVKL